MSNVAHPSHYNSGKIEVIEFIEDQGLNFHKGNAVKYISRAGKKDPAKHVEDLEKAVWYLEREIELLKAAKEDREHVQRATSWCACSHGQSMHGRALDDCGPCTIPFCKCIQFTAAMA